ncbi:hypothetical protein EMIT0194MI4_150018 [Pseudomonas sp. IT-194MI4]
MHLLGLHSFLPFCCYKRDCLTLFQGFKTIALNCFEMHKKVCGTTIWCNESKALFIIEPFNFTLFSVRHIDASYLSENEEM